MFDGTHMNDGWWVLMSLFWIVLVVVIVWAAIVLARRDEGEREARSDTPQQRLDRRLADGEIDVETYDELSRRLRHDRDAVGAGT
jgi:putative membrane protein